MADLSTLNVTLKNLNSSIITNNSLLSRQAASNAVSERLEKTRKLEEQRESERRKRLEGSGSGSGGSGIPGGTTGFFSRLFSGKIGLALLGIGGFAALASRMGGGGNALRKLLDSTIGVLLKIVQEVAAMTADFIGATEVGKAIRNFNLQEYINKALNWLYDPSKKGAEAWFGGIPAKISELYGKFFTEDNKKALSEAFTKFFKFIYDPNKKGTFIDKAFGGIFAPINEARKAIVDAYNLSGNTGIKKFFDFFYNPQNGKFFGGLLDDAFKLMSDTVKSIGQSEGVQNTKNKILTIMSDTFNTVAMFFYDFFTNMSEKLPEFLYNNLTPGMKVIADYFGLTPKGVKFSREINKKSDELIAAQKAEKEVIKENEMYQTMTDPTIMPGFGDIKKRLNEAEAKRIQLENEVERLLEISEMDKQMKAQRRLDFSKGINFAPGLSLNNIDPKMKQLASVYIRNREGQLSDMNEVVPDIDATGKVVGAVAGGVAYPKSDLGRMIPRSEIEAKFDQKVIEAIQIASSVEGYHSLNPGAKLALIDMAYNMGPEKFRNFGPNFFGAVKRGDLGEMQSILEGSKLARQTGTRATYNIDAIDGRIDNPDLRKELGPTINNIITDNSIKKAGDTVSVTSGGGGTTSSSSSGRNENNYSYANEERG